MNGLKLIENHETTSDVTSTHRYYRVVFIHIYPFVFLPLQEELYSYCFRQKRSTLEVIRSGRESSKFICIFLPYPARAFSAHNSKTIQSIAMKFGRVVENHKLINLV